MSFEHEQRVRIRWSPRGQRSWCPGALRPVEEPEPAVAGGWTQFFKRSVVDRLRRGRAIDEPETASKLESTPE